MMLPAPAALLSEAERQKADRIQRWEDVLEDERRRPALELNGDKYLMFNSAAPYWRRLQLILRRPHGGSGRSYESCSVVSMYPDPRKAEWAWRFSATGPAVSSEWHEDRARIYAVFDPNVPDERVLNWYYDVGS